ncbi:MAG: hypothetical protein WDM90_09270 [Ferruginibacter sp.]
MIHTGTCRIFCVLISINVIKQKMALKSNDNKPNTAIVPSTNGKGDIPPGFPFVGCCKKCITTITTKHRLQIKINFEKKRISKYIVLQLR